ncbi:putative transmembrane protein [Gregarina niphandrodes]|uniref:Transmembrane protein n=1 Tax=Gregarina niphandrodes TaxID=110365 RepID=A0A023B5G2_GRENI|nr:putative transmembrane protein [Gregarina niphandrodes]EZG60077.1 putative transmembrane protein [Gregarina niphandrodes]|eukprot:XP_011130861.1 putative transmembrane protein [Gregarina niphandrodes]
MAAFNWKLTIIISVVLTVLLVSLVIWWRIAKRAKQKKRMRDEHELRNKYRKEHEGVENKAKLMEDKGRADKDIQGGLVMDRKSGDNAGDKKVLGARPENAAAFVADEYNDPDAEVDDDDEEDEEDEDEEGEEEDEEEDEEEV